MMEFTIRRDYFINQLNDTLKAISPRTTLPILTGIKIDAKDIKADTIFKQEVEDLEKEIRNQ